MLASSSKTWRKYPKIYYNIEIIRNDNKLKKYLSEAKMFPSLIYFITKYCFYLIRQVWVIPWEKIIEIFSSHLLNNINGSLLDINIIVQIFVALNINFEQAVECNLACDAAIFSLFNGAIIKKVSIDILQVSFQ